MRVLWIGLASLLFLPAAEKVSFTVDSARVAWTPVSLPGVSPGLQQRVLHQNKRNQLSSAIVRFPKGFREPRHYHTTCGHSIFMLKGRLRSPSGVLMPGTFNYAAVNERHGPFVAEEASEFIFYTDGPFDYHVEDAK